MASDINSKGYKMSKGGGTRQSGQLPVGDAGQGRSSAIAKGGSMPSSAGEVGDETVQFRGAFADGNTQKFRPRKGGVK